MPHRMQQLNLPPPCQAGLYTPPEGSHPPYSHAPIWCSKRLVYRASARTAATTNIGAHRGRGGGSIGPLSPLRHPPTQIILIHSLSLYGVLKALLRLITSAMLTATSRIQGNDTTFSTSCGVKQSYPVSPLIFVVYYNILLRKVQQLHVPVTAFIDDLSA